MFCNIWYILIDYYIKKVDEEGHPCTIQMK